MTKLKEKLWSTLQELSEDQFKEFKWLLKNISDIPQAKLENAERHITVDLMIQKHQGHGALEVTLEVLKKINRNDLVQSLENFSSEPKELKTPVAAQREGCSRNAKLTWVQQFAVDVTLDPDTAHPHLILSDDGKRVHAGDVRRNLPDHPKRFNICASVLGKQSFSSGRFYFEVQVKGKPAWTVGVAKESVNRRGPITLSPDNGFWTLTGPLDDLYPKPQKVGVFVDYEEGVVSFYDVDSADLLHSFTDWSFTDKLYPLLNPCSNDDGGNSAPLIISPVNHTPDVKMFDSGTLKDGYEKKRADLARVQQFEVEVTLDPETAHPALFLSYDKKQVHDGEELPDNPKRSESCVNVLGKQSFSSGKYYYEVQVKGKTSWTLGVAKESIKRNRQITLAPKNGFWTIWLKKGNEYEANDDNPVRLPLKSHPQKVGVFVDYEDGLVCFYDVDAADLLYTFTDCSFTEKLLPFFSPCNNDDGENSAPLIICPVSRPPNLQKQDLSDQTEEYERKKDQLKIIQQSAVDVTLDPDTAHPALILSKDNKQVYCGHVCKNLPDSRKRFKRCVNVLGKQSFSSGKFYYEVQVTGKTSWTLGVAKESIKRNRQITLAPENGFWTIWLIKGNKYEAIDEPSVRLPLKSRPQKVGVFVDYEDGLVCFYDVDAADLLYAFTDCSFTEKLYPFFSPCTNDGGENSAPLIICPVSRPPNLQTKDLSDQKEEHERKKDQLKIIQQSAVDMTLDPDTAHPNLILSDDGKQVHHGDVRRNLPDSPERFNSCVNVLGKQSFSSGKFYFQVQVTGKTAWTVGVAKESIDRRGDITVSPKRGFWTIWLRKGNEYEANDSPSVRLSLKSHPQKVGVFVDYEDGLVCFYDVDAADLLYVFTDCSFTEKLLPYFSPCTNDSGRNSAPLIICPVSRPSNLKTQDLSDQEEEYERKKDQLKIIQQSALDVTLDPDTAHPNLILSDDGKQVHHGDVRRNLPDHPKRFFRCVNVLGKQSFSSGKFYFEVQVKGKPAWAVGVAKESINRKGQIKVGPEDGFWTILLRKGNEYEANDDPAVHLSLKSQPQKVGVFVDYEDGLVCFYDVDAADLLYAFTDCSFTEKLYPFFTPFTNDGGRNSAPLIICPVSNMG